MSHRHHNTQVAFDYRVKQGPLVVQALNRNRTQETTCLVLTPPPPPIITFYDQQELLRVH